VPLNRVFQKPDLTINRVIRLETVARYQDGKDGIILANKQLFTEVEVNSGGYLPSREAER